jgi:hypothetical protein
MSANEDLIIVKKDENNFDQKDVKLLKLVTGEEVICRISNSSNDENKLVLSKIARIMMSPQGVALIPYPSPLATESENFKDFSFEILKTNIFVIFTPREDLYNAWDEQFGSGIIRAKMNPNFDLNHLELS